jgi:hypothetical protein
MDSKWRSEFALGQAASGLLGKVTSKTKIKTGGKAIHPRQVMTALRSAVNSGAAYDRARCVTITVRGETTPPALPGTPLHRGDYGQSILKNPCWRGVARSAGVCRWIKEKHHVSEPCLPAFFSNDAQSDGWPQTSRAAARAFSATVQPNPPICFRVCPAPISCDAARHEAAP